MERETEAGPHGGVWSVMIGPAARAIRPPPLTPPRKEGGEQVGSRDNDAPGGVTRAIVVRREPRP
jgi:hypothetical protein